ncbi:hypothetical protein B0H14DRAFT_2631856 [Mycena olivaceomarginata]|nr:hypothetical protein B0H14DRAFT_2631856 [Mycena olivaceomarginata]
MAVGVLGTTVQKVDDAATTLLLLKCQSPAMFQSSLHNKRFKQGIKRDEKLKVSPEGLGVAGSSICLYSNIQVDTTFGRTLGDLNEWEFVIWYGSVERILTVGRVYTDGADHPHYKCLFDELQKHPGENLLTLGVDLEAAQVQGASDSLIPRNVPEYSGITITDPDDAPCTQSGIGVHRMKDYVTDDQYTRLIQSPYLKTDTDIDDFTAWIGTLKIKKVTDWWKHKLQYPWILPSLIKSRFRIHPADWDITDSSTNLNGGQHHWTNQRTGV